MKRMLFNATHPEELRVAIVDGQHLIDFDLESAVRAEKKGNIYKAVVTKVEPGLEAAFVEYGAERQGFLPLKEIYRGYFRKYDSKSPLSDVKIAEEIREGQEMVVQVNKDERGAKGAALTTFISLAGRFLVLMPNNPKGGGISRRVSGDERNELRQIVDGLSVDPQHALIARTAGIGREQDELQQDLDFLLKLWNTIETASGELKAPRLIHQESNLIVRSIRDHLGADIAEIIVDEPEIHARAKHFMEQVMPHNIGKLKYYDDPTPLFSRYQIEHQIESAFKRTVTLPSGGSVVIDHSEALISIDVNSARATKGADIEATALQTNLEAVEEIARQLRVRDLGGLVVMDLIDMTISRNQRAVEARLRDALKADRARVQMDKISRFGLLEMSRQRLRSSLSDANHDTCPRCDGTGAIRNVVSSSLSLLRLIEEKALQENTEAIQVVLPLDMATYLLNEKRHEVNQLESKVASRIIIIPSAQLSSPHYQIRRLRADELDELSAIPSYRQPIDFDSKPEDITASLKTAPVETPHVTLEEGGAVSAPAPTSAPKATPAKTGTGGGLFGFIKKLFTSTPSPKPRAKPTTRPAPAAKSGGRGTGRGTRGGTGGGTRGASNRGGNRGTGGGRTPRPNQPKRPATRRNPNAENKPRTPRPAGRNAGQGGGGNAGGGNAGSPRVNDGQGSYAGSGNAGGNQAGGGQPAGDGHQSGGSNAGSNHGATPQPQSPDTPTRPTRRDFISHENAGGQSGGENAGGGGQVSGGHPTGDGNPSGGDNGQPESAPTRRDFAAKDPNQRVGLRRPRQDDLPNDMPAATPESPELPDGNR